MKLCNIKASFILKENVFSTSKKVKNFTFKRNNFTFNIYQHSSYLINVTGLKCFHQLKIAEKIIEEKLQQKVMKVRIDNTFFSQKIFKNIDMNKVYKFMKHNELFHVDYNIELIAGMYFYPKQKHYPTILFFRTGSYTMMGGKRLNILKKCEHIVTKLIERFDKKIM